MKYLGMSVVLAVVILAGGWHRRQLMRSMAARYRTRAARSGALSTLCPEPWAVRPYPMRPDEVLR